MLTTAGYYTRIHAKTTTTGRDSFQNGHPLFEGQRPDISEAATDERGGTSARRSSFQSLAQRLLKKLTEVWRIWRQLDSINDLTVRLFGDSIKTSGWPLWDLTARRLLVAESSRSISSNFVAPSVRFGEKQTCRARQEKPTILILNNLSSASALPPEAAVGVISSQRAACDPKRTCLTARY